MLSLPVSPLAGDGSRAAGEGSLATVGTTSLPLVLPLKTKAVRPGALSAALRRNDSSGLQRRKKPRAPLDDLQQNTTTAASSK